jgi:hypothetical protein
VPGCARPVFLVCRSRAIWVKAHGRNSEEERRNSVTDGVAVAIYSVLIALLMLTVGKCKMPSAFTVTVSWTTSQMERC